jgi:phosphoribosylamine--glycine ligase
MTESKSINTLVVGSGGREATFERLLLESEIISNVIMAPGNGGSQWREDIKPDYPDCTKFIAYLREKNIGIVVSGSETDLVKGLGDRLREANIPFVGASQAAAMFEGSKVLSAKFRHANGIPQARFQIFEEPTYDANVSAALDYGEMRFDQGAKGLAVKLDGLAGGKGVVVAIGPEEYQKAFAELRKHASANSKIVIEDLLSGPEVSVTVLVQSPDVYKVLSFSQDYKRAFDGDKGLNTGGMGAATIDLPSKLVGEIDRLIIKPTIIGAEKAGRSMRGSILYIGLMITPEGPKVCEYNMRAGDPETQVVFPRYAGDVGRLLYALATGNLETQTAGNRKEHFVTIVMAANGYPEDYKASEGKTIMGIEDARKIEGVWVNVAGTEWIGQYQVVKGSRNLNVCASGDIHADALAKAYRGVSRIKSEGLFNRNDIGCHLAEIEALHKRYN